MHYLEPVVYKYNRIIQICQVNVYFFIHKGVESSRNQFEKIYFFITLTLCKICSYVKNTIIKTNLKSDLAQNLLYLLLP